MKFWMQTNENANSYQQNNFFHFFPMPTMMSHSLDHVQIFYKKK